MEDLLKLVALYEDKFLETSHRHFPLEVRMAFTPLASLVEDSLVEQSEQGLIVGNDGECLKMFKSFSEAKEWLGWNIIHVESNKLPF